MSEDHHGGQVGAYRQVRVRLRRQVQQEEGHRRAQGQHHETWRWTLLEELRGGYQSFLTYDNLSHQS